MLSEVVATATSSNILISEGEGRLQNLKEFEASGNVAVDTSATVTATTEKDGISTNTEGKLEAETITDTEGKIITVEKRVITDNSVASGMNSTISGYAMN